jgi:hypothetical protein
LRYTSGAILVFLLIYGIPGILNSQRFHWTTALIIPGGGLTTTGDIPLHTQLRIDRAVEIFQLSESKKFIFIPLSGGTPHKPNPLDKDGFPIFEAARASAKLIDMGIPPELILEENLSLDTIGNAYFLRTIHLNQLGKIYKLVIITNAWHMERTKAIFKFVFSLPDPHEKAGIGLEKTYSTYELNYETVGDGLEASILTSRCEREQASLKAFEAVTKSGIFSMCGLHMWMFNKHSAYASSRHITKTKENVDAAVLQSY